MVEQTGVVHSSWKDTHPSGPIPETWQKIFDMMQSAILGGTFNPVHCGHLQMATAALSQVSLERVVWAPAYLPPQPKSAPLLAFAHRVALIERAIADYPRFELLPIAQTQASKSYAIDTLSAVQAVYPQVERWYWVIGLDSFQSLPRWRQRQALVPQCSWLVAPRGLLRGEAIDPAPLPHGNRDDWLSQQLQQCQQVEQLLALQGITIDWQLLQMPLTYVSSSLVRHYCQEGRSLQGLVPEPVRLYILQHRLYSHHSAADAMDGLYL